MQPSNIFANQRCAHNVLEPDVYKFLQSLRSALTIAVHKPLINLATFGRCAKILRGIKVNSANKFQSTKKRISHAAFERSFTIANLSGSGIQFDALQSGQSVNLTFSCKAS